jgi:hypothetical protein
MQKDRPTMTVSIRLPVDVVDDLQEITPMLEFFSYRALIKAYIGQGLRKDLERLEDARQPASIAKSHQDD